ncbi:MAG: elongation factor G [Opitutales bacterium]|nr:elongation factor G [Opitutales bacterium]
MKQYEAADIRNFAIVGHQASGKTILSDAMLVCSGKIGKVGSIQAGTTVSDYHPSEKERQISVHASLMHTEWMGRKFNIIDTPGYQDFISEGLGALRVGDFALVVVSATSGVELGTTQVWDYATRYGIPKMVVINGCDKEHTRFNEIVDQLKDAFGNNLVPMNIPVNPGPAFNEILDVMRIARVRYATDGSGRFSEVPLEGADRDMVKALHQQVIEYVAETDDTLMERFFEQDGLSEEELRASLHAAIQKQIFVPIFTVSAQNNIGIARLMDIIAKYGSSPVDRKDVDAIAQDGSPALVKLEDPVPRCYVWKTISEAHVGDLSFFRIYSGNIRAGQEVWNADRDMAEKFGPIAIMQGHDRVPVDVLGAGDIGVTVKLRNTHTGDTLSSPQKRLRLPKVVYPTPNIHGALKLANRGEEDKLALGLATLHEEDPTFLYRNDAETSETVISGQGELHLEVIRGRLKRRFGVDIELVEPKVPYRETIKGRGDSKYRHKKQSGGSGQFAEVWLRVEPLPRDSGVEFTQSLVGQNVDRVFVPSVEKGVMSACTEGIVAGCHVTDLKVEFYDGKMHPVDSKDVAFQIAGKAAFKEAFLAAKPCLLEPIYEITIKVPEDYVGDVMGDISSRRGRISGVDNEGGFQIIMATVPQKELYRYSTVLRSLTGGRGLHSEKFSHYEEMPRDQEAKIIEAWKKSRQHDE